MNISIASKVRKWVLRCLIVMQLIFVGDLLAGTAKDRSSPAIKSRQTVSHKYNFSEDWFSTRIPLWSRVLGHLKGKPDIHYLEVGPYEGRASMWMLDNILTAPSAKITVIDIFPDDMKEIFLSNLKISGAYDKATVITGYSQVKLRSLPLNTYDIIYIDGSHVAKDVLEDAILSWRLLKTNGLLIFDDYLWKIYDKRPIERPKIAIDTFITLFNDEIRINHFSAQQVILKKLIREQ